jgi:tRNA 5-methylaminomethyl-2-thiouridine biosynthesis bifunctional protein
VILPAELSFAADGTPFSPAYGDIYHASAGGLAQARHVFLAGNGLPRRWRDSARFVILETGFGLGLNFLATLQAWREHPGRRLHYVAVEKHPLRRADLENVLARWPELAPLAAELLAQWPLPLAGLHRLDFGDATLTLGFGDAAHLLPQLTLAADAIYLDGFAPDRNPDLWSDDIVAQLRRLAAPGATLASWTVAGEVRRRLAAAGFATERRPGFADKREMLAASLPGAASPSPTFVRRRIAVIGAGIAGAATAQALAARGHEVIVIDKGSQAAIGASGNHAGVFRPLPSLDEGRLARLLQAGFLLGRCRFGALPGVRAGWTGVLHIARDMPSTRKASAPSSKRMRCRRSSAATSGARKPPRSPAGRWQRAAGGSPRAAGSTRPASAAPCWPGSNAATISPSNGWNTATKAGASSAITRPSWRTTWCWPMASTPRRWCPTTACRYVPAAAWSATSPKPPPRAATSSPRGWVT